MFRTVARGFSNHLRHSVSHSPSAIYRGRYYTPSRFLPLSSSSSHFLTLPKVNQIAQRTAFTQMLIGGAVIKVGPYLSETPMEVLYFWAVGGGLILWGVYDLDCSIRRKEITEPDQKKAKTEKT